MKHTQRKEVRVLTHPVLDQSSGALSAHGDTASAVRRPDCILAFASSARSVGAAIIDRGICVRATRIRPWRDETGRVRDWIGALVANHYPDVVAIEVGSEHDDLICDAIAQLGHLALEFDRPSIVKALGAKGPSARAIKAAIAARREPRFASSVKLLRSRHGPISNFERYWDASLFALGAAIAARAYVAPARHETPRV